MAFNHTFKRRGKTHAAVQTLMRVSDRDGNAIAPQRLIDAVQWTEGSPDIPLTFIDLAKEVEAAAA